MPDKHPIVHTFVESMMILFFELFGVLTVGTLSLTAPELFQHPSVWSGFGLGYGFIPLALPILGLIAIFRGRV
jgi:hypothetical protein